MDLTRRTMLASAAAWTFGGMAFAQAPPAPALEWRTLREGLALAIMRTGASIGDNQLHALRIDPKAYEFVLLTGRVTGAGPQTARAWARANNLVAATNAAMFAPDGRPVDFAKADGRVVTARIAGDKTVFVFDRTARLLDRGCETFAPDAHANALQGIRMIDCKGRNVWSRQPRSWSISALAEDREGRIIFLHSRSPFPVHDFIEIVRGAPFALTRCMYLEGGPEATLYVNAGDVELERVGSYETGFFENDGNTHAWPLPNVLGVRAK
jgi:hypothetical protein